MKFRDKMLLFSAFFILSVCLAWAAMAQVGATVTAGKTVEVNYTLTVDGKVIDSSKGKKPFTVKIGTHQVIPGFEKNLMGMKTGEKKSFTVGPEEGYGPVNPKAIVEVNKSQMPKGVNIVPGMTLYGAGTNGQTYPARVVKVNKDTVVLDLNSPLAGKTLNFDVEVVGIK